MASCVSNDFLQKGTWVQQGWVSPCRNTECPVTWWALQCLSSALYVRWSIINHRRASKPNRKEKKSKPNQQETLKSKDSRNLPHIYNFSLLHCTKVPPSSQDSPFYDSMILWSPRTLLLPFCDGLGDSYSFPAVRYPEFCHSFLSLEAILLCKREIFFGPKRKRLSQLPRLVVKSFSGSGEMWTKVLMHWILQTKNSKIFGGTGTNLKNKSSVLTFYLKNYIFNLARQLCSYR